MYLRPLAHAVRFILNSSHVPSRSGEMGFSRYSRWPDTFLVHYQRKHVAFILGNSLALILKGLPRNLHLRSPSSRDVIKPSNIPCIIKSYSRFFSACTRSLIAISAVLAGEYTRCLLTSGCNARGTGGSALCSSLKQLRSIIFKLEGQVDDDDDAF